MWALIGYRSQYYEAPELEEIVALFSSKEKAEAYLEASKLKNPGREAFEVFRNKSYLHIYESAWIEKYDPEQYPMDPEL